MLLAAIAVAPRLPAQSTAAFHSSAVAGLRVDGRLFAAKPARGLPGAKLAVADHRIALSQPSHPTQWRKGAVIGGVLGGLLGFLAASALDDPDGGGRLSTVGVTVGGTGVGAIAGALIGGLFPRKEVATPLPTH